MKSRTDFGDLVEYQALLDAESILDEIEVVLPLGASLSGLSERDADNHLRHDVANYHELLAHVRSRTTCKRTIATARLLLQSRLSRAIRRMYPSLG